MSITKKILPWVLGAFLTLLAINYKLIFYGLGQAKGQIEIIRQARPISEVLEDSQFPDSLKTNLRLVDDIKKFAFDSLGINFSKNYSTVYDQKGRELMFVVTACEPFKLEPKEWTFPIVGSFSYKGFFDQQKAISLQKELKDEGFDTNIRTAGGWSTLGWFQDPILSNMLDDDEAGFAELLIHELTHGTLFVKDSVRFNENLATFVGIKGTERYLKNKYGPQSGLLMKYQQHWKDRTTLSEHILRGAMYLDSLYKSMEKDMIPEEKLSMKEAAIGQIIDNIDTLDMNDKEKYIRFYKNGKPNNTLFMSYLRYKGDLKLLESDLKLNYRSNIKEMLDAYKLKYPSL